MDSNQAKQRIEELRRSLWENSRKYYVENAPVISDYEFDTLMHELEALEKEFPQFYSADSPTQKVGSDLFSDQFFPTQDSTTEHSSQELLQDPSTSKLLQDPSKSNPSQGLPQAPTEHPSQGRQAPLAREPQQGSLFQDEDLEGFIQRKHRYPMLSLGNTYSISEIEEFAQRCDKALEGQEFTYCCELKFDGTSISLTYKDGKLSQAVTRGDGEKGDDVTENVKRISNIPHTLKGNYPADFEIRGEILMPYESFDKLNSVRELAGEQPFANPRNAASGSLKLIDPQEVANRGLWCTLYHIPAQSISDSDKAWAGAATHDDLLKKAAEWGLPVSDNRSICKNITEIEAYIDYWGANRANLPYATDGIVIKINQLDIQKTLGYTAKSPRWAVAYKFKAEQALTPVLSIDYQVGRTGAITPVANLSPVPLSGTIVKRATLNNADQMELLDIRVGDYVYVEKGGEIIPKITGVDLTRRTQESVKPQFPTRCPDCGTPLKREEGEAKWFCPNQNGCPMQIKGRLLHFVSRKAMDILAGDATIDQLYEKGLVRTPSDLYKLTKYDLFSLEGWKDKSADNFLRSIQKSREVPFERVLFALGIRFVGEQTAKAVARHFGDIDTILRASYEDLAQIRDVGPVIAQSIWDFMHVDERVKEIESLRGYGLQMSSGKAVSKVSDLLEGQTVVISGNFSISREEMKELIEAHSGKNAGSVSSKTSFLLAGSKPGPEKIKKCEELGIKILSEKEFWDMVNPPLF